MLPALLGFVVAVATLASAQIGFAQLIGGKGNPAGAKSEAPAASGATQAATAQPAGDAGPQTIPLPEVAERSDQLTRTLNAIADSLPTKDRLDAMNAVIADYAAALDSKRQEASMVLATAPSSIELREQENYWRGAQNYSAGRRKQLLDWANAAQSAIDKLNVLEPQWARTLDAYRGQHELEPLLALIRQNLARIRKLRSDAQDELQLLVRMQIATGAQDQSAAEVLNQFMGAQEVYKDRLLSRDSLPFWQLSLRREQGENASVYATANSRVITIKAFFQEHAGTMGFLLLLLAVSLAISSRLASVTKGAQPEDPLQAEAVLLVRRWVALGMLAPLLLAYSLAPSAPVVLIGVAIVLSFFPILRLLAPLLTPRQRRMLYYLAGYYGLNMLLSWLSLRPVLRREFGFLLVLALFGTFAYLLRPSFGQQTRERELGRPPLILAGRLAVVVLGVSLLANFFGYVRLAQYIGLACIFSAFIAITMYTGVQVYDRLLQAGLKLPQSDRLAVARLHRNALLRWVPRILNWTAVAVWLSATLDLLRIRDAMIETLRGVLSFSIGGSGSTTTLGRVLGFFLMLAVGYLLAGSIRFLLREEVLSRFHLARGLPDVIASTVYYLVLLFVFLVAVNTGGIELNKFTLLTGALGVGFGFGLQNVINNFVSGLILQFERPIHMHDVLEVEGVTGTVTRIGVRSSTLLTGQGAEVIIPNGNLISGKVINWTLSESKRRGELAVGVAYGTEPGTVIKILLDAANRHESVLTDPPPAAYLKGFGESSLDFELQFWVMQDSNWMGVRSDIAMTAMKALDNAGIEIPFPQRDLHLRTIAEGAQQAPATRSSETEFPGSPQPAPVRTAERG